MHRTLFNVYIFMNTLLMGVGAVALDAGVGDEAEQDTNLEVDAGYSDNSQLADAGVSTDPVSIDATVTILTPAEGDTLEGPWIEVSFHVQGCTVNSPSQDPDGCHLHKILDGVNYQEEGGGGLGHYNPTPLQMNIGSAGSHEIKLILVRNDGTDLAYEPEISDSVTINVDIESSQSEAEEEAEEEEEEYVAPIREKSEGCSCETSKEQHKLPLYLLGLVFAFRFRRRRRL